MQSKSFIHRNGEVTELRNIGAEERERIISEYHTRISKVISEYFMLHPEKLEEFIQEQYIPLNG